MPEETSDEPDDNGKLGEVIAKGGPGKDGEGSMGLGTDVAIHCDGDGHDGGAKNNAENCFPPGKESPMLALP